MRFAPVGRSARPSAATRARPPSPTHGGPAAASPPPGGAHSAPTEPSRNQAETKQRQAETKQRKTKQCRL
jgi:hypothetical protein